jgi:hypothetical protein
MGVVDAQANHQAPRSPRSSLPLGRWRLIEAKAIDQSCDQLVHAKTRRVDATT